jgi:hypothetical protein
MLRIEREDSMKTILLIFLVFLSVSTVQAKENSLALHIIPPNPQLNWKTPRRLLLSLIKASAIDRGHYIGHVTVEVKCEPPAGFEKPIHFMAGMTSKNDDDESTALFKEKVGLGLMFYPFIGHHETTEEIAADIPIYVNQNDRFASLRYMISHETCLRLHKYWEEYSERIERDGIVYYGLDDRPRYGEGAGCTAYAVSYVELAGLLNPELKKTWSRTLRVPERYIGTPDRPVSVWNVLKAGYWAREDQPHRSIFFYDTQPMYWWLRKLWRNIDNLPHGYSVDTEMQNRFKRHPRRLPIIAIKVDAIDVPTPRGPIWLD